MIIVQIAPVIGPGTGVGAVAHHLEQEWTQAGHEVHRFTMREARGDWLPQPGGGISGKMALALRVVWFSTVGTALARKFLRRMPDEAVSVCHNDVLAGDVYVNHGILLVAMRSRGRFVCRMVRNPLHLFTSGRDAVRFAGRTHDVVVNLTEIERQSLRRTYPRVRPTAIVVGNGVDIERFRPPAPSERATARDALGLTDEMVVSLFIGHEYDRKGLYPLMEAVAKASARHHLVVVGGTASMVERLRARGHSLGVTDRLHIVGQASDPRPYLHAAEVLVSPSAYESYGLVVLEALACGVPVIATPVGCVPEVIRDGTNGFVTTGDNTDIATQLARLAQTDRSAMSVAARSTAELRSWPVVAGEYLDALAGIRTGKVPGVAR